MFNLFKLRNKSQTERRDDKYTHLFRLLQKIILRAHQEGCHEIVLGLPNLETKSETTELPVFMNFKDSWNLVFEVPKSLHIPMLSMIEEFIVDDTDLEIDILKSSVEDALKEIESTHYSKFQIETEDGQSFHVQFGLNEIYNYKLTIKTRTNGST